MIIFPQAAHCIEQRYTEVVVYGGILTNIYYYQHIVNNRAHLFVHSQYNVPRALNNDIGLIYMQNAPTNLLTGYSKYIGRIHLPLPFDENDELSGRDAMLSGYGKINAQTLSNVLRYGRVTIISNPDCAKHYGTGTVTDGVLCSEPRTGYGVCGGDSGSN